MNFAGPGVKNIGTGRFARVQHLYHETPPFTSNVWQHLGLFQSSRKPGHLCGIPGHCDYNFTLEPREATASSLLKRIETQHHKSHEEEYHLSILGYRRLCINLYVDLPGV